MLLSIPIWTQYVDLIQWGLRVVADFTGNAGIAVIVFTIVIKTLLMPLTIKSVRSTYAMQELQPKIKELQKKYGKDRQRLSAEQMKLYQEHGVSPASGCLPMLLQMPVFWGLYIAIRHLASAHVGVWGQGFLWIPTLASADPLHILPILAGVFQLIQTRMTRPSGMGKIDDPQQQMMMTMTMFMPLMVVVFGWAFASGPVIYWVTQSAYSVVQQWFISGWGAMLDWLPWLPDLPEHRRLGYEHPDKRAERIARASTGSGGFFGMLQRQAEKQQQKIGESRPESEDEEPVATTGTAKPTTKGRSRSGGRSTGASRNGLASNKAGESVGRNANGKGEGAGTTKGKLASNQNLVPRRSRDKRRPE